MYVSGIKDVRETLVIRVRLGRLTNTTPLPGLWPAVSVFHRQSAFHPPAESLKRVQMLIFNDILLIAHPKSEEEDHWSLLAWLDLGRIDIMEDLLCYTPEPEFGVPQRTKSIRVLLSYPAPAISANILSMLLCCYAQHVRSPFFVHRRLRYV